MFDNIGGKLKTVAVVVCVLGIILSVVYGVMLFSSSFVSGLLAMVLGALLSWLSTLTLYGFGVLIEETVRNREISAQLLSVLKPEQPPVQSESSKRAASIGSYTIPGAKTTDSGIVDGWKCQHCGTTNQAAAQFCRDCGEYK